ncbi:hypothetical protein VSR68_30605 [Paraburkholderia phymatum]|uniref:hypothetical protein n=1 Tax=Paraburkholderia phymatum TaxID=148447 RepID=UPI00317E42F8
MKRIQLDIEEKDWAEMESFMKECGIDTRKDFFNYGYAVLKWIVDERKKGCYFKSVGEDGKEKELQLPFFHRIDRAVAVGRTITNSYRDKR